jgi:predicted short-subunit dehydrogenase-like oxidoreductase (DUF2520 family)
VSDAAVILVAVRDNQLGAALTELAAAPLAPRAVVLHASGSADPRAELDALRRLGHPTGTFHPLVPIPDPDRAPALLRGAWIGIRGDAEAVATARSLAAKVGAAVLTIPSSHRAAYHAAAVFASNFPTVLAALAARLMHRVGVEEDAARAAVYHLMVAAVQNLAEAKPGEALTGPLIRGDVETIARHLKALAVDPELDAVYRVLSRAAIPLAAAQGADPAALERIARLIASPGPVLES